MSESKYRVLAKMWFNWPASRMACGNKETVRSGDAELPCLQVSSAGMLTVHSVKPLAICMWDGNSVPFQPLQLQKKNKQ